METAVFSCHIMPPATEDVGGIKRCFDPFVRSSVCLSRAFGQNGIVTMLDVEPIGQRGPMTTGSCRNGLDLEKSTSSVYPQ